MQLARTFQIGAVVFACGLSARAQCVVLEDFVYADDGAGGDRFGGAVVADGDFLYVGAPNRFYQKGTAYVFRRVALEWTQVSRIDPPNFDPNGEFASSMAHDGSWLVIGQPAKDGPLGYDEGRVEAFTGGGATWTHFATLSGAGVVPYDHFGSSVAIDGNTIAVGASRQGGTGRIHVFDWDGTAWNPGQTLVPGDAQSGDLVGGGGLALRGDWLAVGASEHDTPASGCGAVYVFERSAGIWTQQAKLTASDATSFDSFGGAVALRANTLLVGAYHADGTSSGSGKAYVLLRQNGFWAEQAHLYGPSGSSALFGTGVALGNDVAVVGAQGRSEARLFHRTGTLWTQVATLTSAWTGDQLGAAADYDGDTVYVGAPAATKAGVGSTGAVRTWRDGGVVGTYCTAKVSSQGCLPQISISGVPSVSGAPCTVGASSMPDNKSGLFFYSTSGPHSAQFLGGWLCALPPLRRTPLQNSGGAAPCGGSFTFDFASWVASGNDPGLIAGVRFFGQFWSRDPGFAPPNNVNLTDAVYGTLCP